MKGILGKKIGMTQVFTKEGKLIPVTVIEVEPNVVTQIKTVEKDGYDAIQLGAQTIREKLSNKPELGHVKKANTTPKRFLREIRGVNVNDYTLGQTIGVDIFEAGEIVDVTGTSKGKGFQGVIKRHNQSRGPMGHGSQYHRGVGSLGTMLPMHVLKGKKLPGHMGNVACTIQNLEIIEVCVKDNYILVSGNIPGPKKSLVLIKSAVKGGKVEPKDIIINESVEEETTPVEDEANKDTDDKKQEFDDEEFILSEHDDDIASKDEQKEETEEFTFEEVPSDLDDIDSTLEGIFNTNDSLTDDTSIYNKDEEN